MIQERWVEELKPNYKRWRVCLSLRKVESVAREQGDFRRVLEGDAA